MGPRRTGYCRYHWRREKNSAGASGPSWEELLQLGVPYVHKEPTGGGVSNSGGSTGPKENEKLTPEREPVNPCDYLKNFLANDVLFKTLLGGMRDNNSKLPAGSNTEYGLYITKNVYGSSKYESTVVQTNANGVGGMRIPSNPINAYVHSHAKGTNSVFSFTDLEAFFDMTYNRQLANIDNFVLGLITSDGDTYMLSIDNWADFARWGCNTFKADIGKYDAQYDAFRLGMNRTKDNNSRELELIKYLTESRTGLKLHKGDVTNFGVWQRKGYNTTSNAVVNDNCL